MIVLLPYSSSISVSEATTAAEVSKVGAAPAAASRDAAPSSSGGALQPACRTAGSRTLAEDTRTCICTLIRERNFGRTLAASFKYGQVIWLLECPVLYSDVRDLEECWSRAQSASSHGHGKGRHGAVGVSWYQPRGKRRPTPMGHVVE